MIPSPLPPAPSDEKALQLLKECTPETMPRKIGYGTAGFREKVLDVPMTSIMVRTAIIAVLRSIAKKSATGVMITASHNDESYNGVKIADPDGGMMPATAEAKIVWIVNHENVDELWKWISAEKDSIEVATNPPTLYLGRDTRSHSEGYRDAMVPMAQALGAKVVDLGVVTTPILHHSVLHGNYIEYLPKTLIAHRPKVAGYLDLLAYSYVSLLQTKSPESCISSSTLLVDCACGVGYPALTALLDRIQAIEPGVRVIQPTNGPGMGPLNDKCGSEHVQKGICAPTWYESTIAASTVSRHYCASFDGDADRIVFFDDSEKFLLFDGDKITCLICGFIEEQLKIIKGAPNFPKLKLGVVQTAYANGASTKFLENMLGKEAVCIAKTGVKHVHAAAHKNFDVGIYFEANGHGTILFGPEFYRAVDIAQREFVFTHGNEKDTAACTAIQRLSLLPSLVNQAVGDALSDLLLVDVILSLKTWSLQDWHNLYQDYPSRQIKVRVKDRTIIKTNENETLCLSPTNVQKELNAAMQDMKTAGGPNGVARTFVRPSGTEDVVRIYAEALTRSDADKLAYHAAGIVHRLCAGVGDPPSLP